MGLLSDIIPDDPVSQNALLSLAAGMMAGRPSQGLLAASQVSSPEARARLGLTQAQLEEAKLKTLAGQYDLRRLMNWDSMVNGPQGQPSSAPQFGGNDIRSPGAFMPAGDGMGPTAPLSSAPAALTSAPSPGWQYGLRGLPDGVSRAVANSMRPDDYMKLMAQQNAPQTDIEKLMAAQGIDRSSPIGQHLLQQATQKANYTAPVNARPGSIIRDPFNPQQVLAFNPHIPEGTRPVFDAQGNVTEYQPIGNAEAAIGLGQRAQTYGKAQATPSIVYGPDWKPQFSTVAQDVGRAGGGPQSLTPNGTSPELEAGRNAILQKEFQKAQVRGQQLANDPFATPEAKSRNQADITDLQAQLKRGGVTVTPQLPPGLAHGATASQDELSKKWSELNALNGQAQTTKSYLDSIKQLATKAATGPFTDKLQFANALLAQVGSERAQDATTANALLQKYGNQIVSRLGGSGGLSTDAARAILQSAYPNAHMTVDAIHEAADNLIGANAMIQAKAGLLAQHANARDPAAYSQRELAFDQAADPRIWQLANMDAAKAQQFLSRLPPNVQASLRKQALALKQMGAL